MIVRTVLMNKRTGQLSVTIPKDSDIVPGSKVGIVKVEENVDIKVDDEILNNKNSVDNSKDKKEGILDSIRKWRLFK